MGIIDYIYFKFVALRKLKKAFKTGDVYIRVRPDFQAIRSIDTKKWIIDRDYRLSAKIGLKEYKIKGGSFREVLRELLKSVI
jgi:hypothetical protein